MDDHPRSQRDYLFYGQTTSLCEECLQLVPAKILFQGKNVYYRKHCKHHGYQKTLVSDDVEYFKLCKEYIKPGDVPHRFQTKTEYGCPFDCGLCPDHEQHSCLGILEICEECNLKCPICFNHSGPGKGKFKTLEEVSQMLDLLVANEKEPDLVQISGGEPTLHPQVLDIIKLAKKKGVRHVMLNTNGVRLSTDEAFVKALAAEKKGFEVYLQFDSLRPEALKDIRGADLSPIRQKALENLEKHNISTTLVCVVKKGLNDDEVDDIIQFATRWRCVRGVTFQPIEVVGRLNGETKESKVLLSEVRRRIIEGTNNFGAKDVIPLPCHPESIAIGYGLKSEGKIVPVTSLLSREDFLAGAENAITFEKNEVLKKQFLKVFSLDACGDKAAADLKSMLCCLPQVEAPGLSYDNVFRVVIIAFMDKYDFCVASIKRSCIHFVEPTRIVPFETYNLFHRKGLEAVKERAMADTTR